MRSLLSLLILLIATGAIAADELSIRCDTRLWASNTSEAELVATFGGDNIRWTPILLGEGQYEDGTVVFPHDGKRRIEVLWYDSASRRHPRLIQWIAPYETYHHIRPGTRMKELEAINDSPLNVQGFESCGGGSVNWMRGKLDDVQPGGCRVHVVVTPKAATGDQWNGGLSTNPAMQALDPAVREILLTYPKARLSMP